MLGIAHVLRQACLGQRPLSPIESSILEHALVRQLLGSGGAQRPKSQLGATVLARVVGAARGCDRAVLSELLSAAEAGLVAAINAKDTD
jgi:hypothetical protein